MTDAPNDASYDGNSHAELPLAVKGEVEGYGECPDPTNCGYSCTIIDMDMALRGSEHLALRRARHVNPAQASVGNS